MKQLITLTSAEGKTVSFEAEKGETLYEALSRNGVGLSAPCAGRGKCGKCKVEVNGIDRLACQTRIESDLSVRLHEAESSILTKGNKLSYQTDGSRGLAYAVDIGTTTVAAYLMDEFSGEQLAATSFLNPQRVHGADVISRMSFAEESLQNRMLLQREILQALNQGLQTLLKKAGFFADTKTDTRVFVGNTAMMHLFGGLDTSGIAKAPYIPAYTALHRQTLDGCAALLGGCISGYVGADTVAAMLSGDLDRTRENVLLLDIGTNGEIALKCKDELLCCSCAAGPAFEGAHIACGTGAIAGAVDHLRANGQSFEYSTIGGKTAAGICGSGLVDAVAYLLEEELITPVGRMKERFAITDSIYIDPADIREVQLAKAAIAAGIDILLDRAGIGYKDVASVQLAGGFGNFIDVHSACTIGLLPPELEKKVIPVGNAAGDGAKMMALSGEALSRAESLRRKARYIELSAQDDFEDIYTEKLLFEAG